MKFFFLILSLFLFSQCGVKSTTPTVDEGSTIQNTQNKDKDKDNPILGSWTWQHSKLCQRTNPAASTPKTCNCEVNLVVQNEKVTKIQDGKEIWSVPYSMEKMTEMGDYFPYYFKSSKLSGYVHLEDERLEITQCPVDGEEHVYVR